MDLLTSLHVALPGLVSALGLFVKAAQLAVDFAIGVTILEDAVNCVLEGANVGLELVLSVVLHARHLHGVNHLGVEVLIVATRG